MARKTCSTCGGSGGYWATERVPNPAGGMFREIQVRKTCPACVGNGSIWVSDDTPSVRNEGRNGGGSGGGGGPSGGKPFEAIAAEWIAIPKTGSENNFP